MADRESTTCKSTRYSAITEREGWEDVLEGLRNIPNAIEVLKFLASMKKLADNALHDDYSRGIKTAIGHAVIEGKIPTFSPVS